MKKFYVITPLGFEAETASEIRRSWLLLLGKNGQVHTEPLPELILHKGGVELECDEFLGFQLNFFVKTASRVLLRLASFKARDFPKLHEKLKSIPWREYFTHGRIDYKVSASRSRLNHEGRIQETAEKTIGAFYKGLSAVAREAEAEGRVYIRIDEDLCTVSLDTTGEHLHKRGWAPLKGEAPLRETIAAFILRQMIGQMGPEVLRDLTLWDPMMGSGTFLLEARALHYPQWQRSFAFQKFKCCPKLFLSPSFALNYKAHFESPFAAYKGSDRDGTMLPVAQENWRSLEGEISRTERGRFQPARVSFEKHALFQDEIVNAPRTWIVTNPPYGKRLVDQTDREVSQYFRSLTKTGAEKIAILYPEKWRLHKGQCPAGYRLVSEVPINNGGVKTLLTVIERA